MSSANFDQEAFDRETHRIGRRFFNGVGGTWLARTLVLSDWEADGSRVTAGKVLNTLLSSCTPSSEELSKIKPWFQTFQNPPKGKRVRDRKKSPGPLDVSRVSRYFTGAGSDEETGFPMLNPVRVWGEKTLAHDLETVPAGTYRPVVGSSPIVLKPGRVFIEVSSWATEADVLEAYQLGVRPFLEQYVSEARPLTASSGLEPLLAAVEGGREKVADSETRRALKRLRTRAKRT